MEADPLFDVKPYDYRAAPRRDSRSGRPVNHPRVTSAHYMVLPKKIVAALDPSRDFDELPTEPLVVAIAWMPDAHAFVLWRARGDEPGLIATHYIRTGAARIKIEGFLNAEDINEEVMRDFDYTRWVITHDHTGKTIAVIYIPPVPIKVVSFTDARIERMPKK